MRWENKHGQIFFVPMLTFSNEHQERTEASRQVRQTDRNCRILIGVALGIPHCPKLSKCHYSPFSSKRFPILPAWNLQKYIDSQTRIKLSPSNDHEKLPYTKRFSSRIVPPLTRKVHPFCDLNNYPTQHFSENRTKEYAKMFRMKSPLSVKWELLIQ